MLWFELWVAINYCYKYQTIRQYDNNTTDKKANKIKYNINIDIRGRRSFL